MTGPDPVHLQVLLRASSRSVEGREAAGAALKGLGLEVTGSGQVTLSVRATPAAFTRAFGVAPPKDRDVTADLEVTVPSALANWVQSVSVAPQHQIISDGSRAGKGENDP